MARISNTLLKGLTGSIGELVFYKVGGKTYIRTKPGKQRKAIKAKTSFIKRRSQSVMTQTHALLKNITHIIRFGYQNQTEGASRPYHAAVSYISKNAFIFEGPAKVLDIRRVKVSRGGLLGPQDAKALRLPGGVEFTWTDNSSQGSARATDEAFVFLLTAEGKGSKWEFLGSRRSVGKHVLDMHSSNSDVKWHAWIAFSQENLRTKKRMLSDSVYLGLV